VHFTVAADLVLLKIIIWPDSWSQTPQNSIEGYNTVVWNQEPLCVKFKLSATFRSWVMDRHGEMTLTDRQTGVW